VENCVGEDVDRTYIQVLRPVAVRILKIAYLLHSHLLLLEKQVVEPCRVAW
jgi:hypothetical protein